MEKTMTMKQVSNKIGIPLTGKWGGVYGMSDKAIAKRLGVKAVERCTIDSPWRHGYRQIQAIRIIEE